MATLALVAAVPLTGLEAGTVAFAAASFAAGALGAYLDSALIMPGLFGDSSPRPDQFAGIDLSTADPGAPRNLAFGSAAIVEGHVMMLWGPRDTTQSTSKGKGASVQRTIRKADVGVAWSDGLTSAPNLVFADNRWFWARGSDRVAVGDHRLYVLVLGGNSIEVGCLDTNGPDFGAWFAVGETLRLSGFIPTAANGLWRVTAVNRHSSVGPAQIVLAPLEGQTFASAVAGTEHAPARFVRVDGDYIDHTWSEVATPAAMSLPQPQFNSFDPLMLVANVSNAPLTDFVKSRRWQPGTRVRLRNFTPAGLNILYDVFGYWSATPTPPFGVVSLRALMLRPADPSVSVAAILSPGGTGTAGNSALPGQIIEHNAQRFRVPDAASQHLYFVGTDDQAADPTAIANGEDPASVPAFRGLSRSTFLDMDLTAFGDRSPEWRAVVEGLPNETTVSTLRALFGSDALRRHGVVLTEDLYDLSLLQAEPVLGYSVRGPQPTASALQPFLLAYGIETQDRGGRLTFFRREDADLHQLRRDELGAYTADGQKNPTFRHQPEQDRTLPKRVVVSYRDPLREYGIETQQAGLRNPGVAQQSTDTLSLNLERVSLYSWQAKRVADTVFLDMQVGRDGGTIWLPPSRSDIAENDRVTFTALNEKRETCTLSSGAIAHTATIAPIEAFSVEIEVRFLTAGNARIVDDGNGALVGFPPGVTPTTATVDYATGAIALDADDDVADARLRYTYQQGWKMRVQQVTRHRNRMLKVEVVAVAEDFAVVGSTVTTPPTDPPVFNVVSPVAAEILDVPGIYHDAVLRPHVAFAVGPLLGAPWRGAVVYVSYNGSDYEPAATIEQPVTMGQCETALGTTASPFVQDWASVVTVQLNAAVATASIEALSAGINWALIGNEIVAFQDVTPLGDDRYALTGLFRGLRDTVAEIGTHAVGDRFVLLTGLGFFGAIFEIEQGQVGSGSTMHFKVVPAGGVVAETTAVTMTVNANNVRSFAPTGVAVEMSGSDVVVTWQRRTRDVVPTFSAGSAAPLLEPYERYRVRIEREGAGVRDYYVGGPNTGSPWLNRELRLTAAQLTALGFVGGDVLSATVYQIGQGGPNLESRPSEEVSITL